jgi:hypothetical protein
VWVRIPPPAPAFSKFPGFTQVRDFTSDAVLPMLFVSFCKGFVKCGEVYFETKNIWDLKIPSRSIEEYLDLFGDEERGMTG